MKLEAPPFAIGQEVWIASAHAYFPVRVLCPVCHGKRSVALILGNGEHVPIECEFCQRGCDPPSGTVTKHQAASDLRSGVVSGIEKTDSGWRTVVGHESFPGHLRELFADRETAEACRLSLHAEAEREAERAEATAEIVAWLRNESDNFNDPNAALRLAEDIERGAHLGAAGRRG